MKTFKDDPPNGTTADKGRAFFVSAINGDKAIALAGPFHLIDEARQAVEPAKTEAMRVDPRAHWYSYGTCQAPQDTTVAFPQIKGVSQ